MAQTSNTHLTHIADNNVKVDQAIDGIVDCALTNASKDRADINELQKTAKLLIISDLTTGGTVETDGGD
ncbi:MAG: hypothetical protein P8J27_09430 [Mariniblastus sp.]|nr:hypothetical protein [Mariniblastus sp.]